MIWNSSMLFQTSANLCLRLWQWVQRWVVPYGCVSPRRSPPPGRSPVSWLICRARVVGISMGLLILRSYEESLHKQCSWWVLIFSFITFLLFAIFWNIFAYELLGVQIPPPPWWHAPLRWPRKATPPCPTQARPQSTLLDQQRRNGRKNQKEAFQWCET